MKKLLVFFSAALAGVSLMLPTQVFAQQIASPSTGVQIQASSLPTTDLQSLRDQYSLQIDKYKTDDRDYSIARDQYYQLQTLVSLEDAVKSTRQVLLSRLDVLLTYTQMMRLQLIQTDGIDLQLKQTELKKIDILIQDLKKNQALTNGALDKAHIDQAIIQFNAMSDELKSYSNETRSLILYGNIQAVFDKTVAARDNIKTTIEQGEMDPLRLSEKKRAFDQIDQTVQATALQLKNILLQMQQLVSLNATSQTNTISNGDINDSLGGAYAGISRALSYLREVVNT